MEKKKCTKRGKENSVVPTMKKSTPIIQYSYSSYVPTYIVK